MPGRAKPGPIPAGGATAAARTPRAGKPAPMTELPRPAAAAPRAGIARFEDIPNVGPRIAGDFRLLGIGGPADLAGRDPYALYDDLCRRTGVRQDPCVLDTFIAAVRWMEGGPTVPWWSFTAGRKAELVRRAGQAGGPKGAGG